MNIRQEITAVLRRALPVESSGNILHSRLIILAVIGLILVAAGNFLTRPSWQWQVQPGTPPQTAAVQPSQGRSYEEQLEAKLTGILAQVKGAGAVTVNITLDSGPNQEYAKNIVKESKVIQEKDTAGGIRTTTESRETEQLILSKDGGAERPVMVREIKPTIKGVLVVAEGAGDSRIKAQLTQAVEAVLGIPPYKITVLPQKGR